MKAPDIIMELAQLYHERCFVCHGTVKRKGFTIHHLYYLKKDVRYKNYKNRDRYYQDLYPLVKAKPDRFLLLCNKHHQSIERLKRFKNDNFERLAEAVRLSK